MRTQTGYSKKRILFIMTLPPPIHGSAVMSQYIKDSEVIKEAFVCDFVNLSTSRSMDEIGRYSPIKIKRLLFALINEFWLLLTHRYDLCYLAITCHGTGFLKDAPFVLMCKLFGKKIVIHQHNKGMNNDAEKWPYRWLLPICYKSAKVVLLSWRLYPDVERIVRKEDVFICPNGISISKCDFMIKANPVQHLLFLSNLIFSKGVIVLLDALKIIKREGLTFICDIVGSETKEINKESLKEEINKRDLNGLIVYHGQRCGEKKKVIFETADIFVHPTLDDCFPLVLLEAMNYGIPIVSTAEGGIPDIIIDGESGMISGKGDPESLADNIMKLLKDKRFCNRIGNTGYTRFLEKFTVEIFENRMADILKQITA